MKVWRSFRCAIGAHEWRPTTFEEWLESEATARCVFCGRQLWLMGCYNVTANWRLKNRLQDKNCNSGSGVE